MAIQMTRAEYEATYGVKPTFNSVDTFDTTPAPTLMTRAEYEAKYRPESVEKPPEEARKDDWRYKVGDFIVNKTPIGIPFKMGESAKAGADRFKTGVDQTVEGTQGNNVGLIGRGILNEIGGGLGIAFSPITGLVNWGAGLPGIKQTVSAVDKYLIQPTADKISDSPYMQSLAMAVPQDVAENSLILGMALFGGAKQKPIKSAIKTGIREAEYTIMGQPGVKGSGLVPKAQTAIQTFQQNRQTVKINEVAGTLASIEGSYAGLRKAKKFEKGADASLERIAKAHIDSGLLNDIVDTTGTINTANAIKRYAAETVDGSEGVVRQNLALEKAKVNIAQVEAEMLAKIDSSFEGAALTNAVNGVKKEIAGLRARADEFGDVLLEKIQDAKVQTNSGIDYRKETTNAIKYKKMVANTYKTIIENKSQFKITIDGKQYGVKQINEALGKFYQDMDRLRALDGRKVNGGKLSKYFAQISGNIIGGAAGSVIGGPVGMALGTVVGGETAGYLRGKGMAGTFSRGGEGMLEKNPLLQEAKIAGKKPAEVNLKIADPVVGTPKGIPKTKEITVVEAQIKRNVEAQKKAIKDGDFGLVATLKATYQALVSKLKDLIKKIKDTPNKQGGFIKNPLNQSNNLGNRNKQYKNSNITNKTAIPNPTTKPSPQQALITEAKKYKSAEEFVKAQKSPVFLDDKIDYKKTLDEILDYSELYDKFPELKKYKVIQGSKNSRFQPEGYITEDKKIIINSSGQYGKEVDEMSTLLHEIEHYIQDLKQSTAGTRRSMTKQEINAVKILREKAAKETDMDKVDNIFEEINKIQGKASGYEEYFNNPFEVLARKAADQIKTKSQLTDIWNKANKK